MARLSELYPSKYLAAGDLPDEGLVLTIRHMEVEKMRDGTDKPVLYFDEEGKGLALNKTNAKTIEKLYGDDTDEWEHQRITLYPSEVVFNGENVACIRIRNKRPKPTVPPNGAQKPAPGKPVTNPSAVRPNNTDDEEDDESSPF